jgi:predicted branched-subunit amino acid permease
MNPLTLLLGMEFLLIVAFIVLVLAYLRNGHPKKKSSVKEDIRKIKDQIK